MALANSAVQEVKAMKTLAMAAQENPNSNSVFRNPSYQLNHHNHHNQVSQSLINFKCGINNLLHKNINESLLSFEPQGVCDQDTFHWADQQQRLMDDPNCFQTATNYSPPKDNKTAATDHNGSVYEWLYSEPTSSVSDAIINEAAQDIANQKRPHMGGSSGGVCKKQCTSASATTKKQKPKSSAAKDPQSIAAKNRRERISERLKILQELVPNGSKVDLVTMLEKAISYVKFLQLQVKILATDEFWPVQGGKAPDISQVKEAIDAILSSQRERSSSSNSEK